MSESSDSGEDDEGGDDGEGDKSRLDSDSVKSDPTSAANHHLESFLKSLFRHHNVRLNGAAVKFIAAIDDSGDGDGDASSHGDGASGHSTPRKSSVSTESQREEIERFIEGVCGPKRRPGLMQTDGDGNGDGRNSGLMDIAHRVWSLISSSQINVAYIPANRLIGFHSLLDAKHYAGNHFFDKRPFLTQSSSFSIPIILISIPIPISITTTIPIILTSIPISITTTIPIPIPIATRPRSGFDGAPIRGRVVL